MALSTLEISALTKKWPHLKRSFEVYHGDQPRDDAMDALYARFLTKGSLAFDIGSHVGDRIGSFRVAARASWRWNHSRIVLPPSA